MTCKPCQIAHWKIKMIFSSQPFLQKTNEWIQFCYYETYFCSFFGGNWRQQKDISKLTDLYYSMENIVFGGWLHQTAWVSSTYRHSFMHTFSEKNRLFASDCFRKSSRAIQKLFLLNRFDILNSNSTLFLAFKGHQNTFLSYSVIKLRLKLRTFQIGAWSNFGLFPSIFLCDCL